jgi:hypothetical protein
MKISVGNRTQAYVVFLPNIRLNQLRPNVPNFNVNEDREIRFPTTDTPTLNDLDDLDDLACDVSTPKTHDVPMKEEEIDMDDIFDNPPDDYEDPHPHDHNDHKQQDKQLDEDDSSLLLDRVSMNTLIGSARSIPVAAPVLDELPKYYYFKSDDKNEAHSTNLLCWACSSAICEEPWQLPISTEKLAIDGVTDNTFYELGLDASIKELIDSDKSKHRKVKQVRVMRVEGIFCHIPCMGRYCTLPEVAKRINIWQSKMLIHSMYKDRTGAKLTDIPISENPFLMSKYCGPGGLTESEYYKKNMEILKTYSDSIFC